MSKRNRYASRAIPLILLALGLLIGAGAFTPLAQRAQRFNYIITKKLLVLNDAEVRGDVVQSGDQTITGDLTVTGDTVLGDATASDSHTITGNMALTGGRDAATGYDYFLAVDGDIDGVGSGAKTYGLYIDMERTVANTNGNIDDAAGKFRIKTSATSRTAGIVQTGLDVESKTDDDHYAGTIRGAQITAVGDAGSTSDAVIALRAHAEMSGDATTTLQVADFELNRKDATDPTYMWGLNIRNTSSAGGGAGTAIRLESSYGAGGAAADDDWLYGLDMSQADISTCDIRFSQGECLDNSDDGSIAVTGKLDVSDDLVFENDEYFSNDTDGTVDLSGNLLVAGARDATSGYDYFAWIEGDVTGTLSGAKTYGLFVDMERTANTAHGNIDDAGIKVRYKTSAASRTAGIVETGGDFEGKVDDGHAAGTIRGAVATAVLDSTATADAQIAFRAHAELDTGATATAVTVGDFELNRKSANEPTTEYGITLRNTSSAGTGADVGFRLESSYGAGGSSANADWVYGLDMNDADIVTADIRLSQGETIDNVTDGTITLDGDLDVTGVYSGNATITGSRDGAADYDYFLTIEGDVDGAASGAKTYGIYVDMERTAANDSGNIDDAAMKLRYKTSATSRVLGIVQSGADIEAKNDDGHWTGTLRGAQVTAVTDEGGYTDDQIALRAHTEIAVTSAVTNVQIADFELNRKSATEPTTEYGVNVRNTSSLGTGADVGYRLESSYGAGGSSANADWVYGIDLSPADIVTADIKLSNGETISNVTDTAVQVGGFLALTEGSVVEIAAGGTITPVASYQPIETSESGSTTTDTTTAIADGAVAGAILILCNEDAQDIVIDDGANTDIGGNQTLTGGADDCLWLIWNGADWNKIAEIGDN